jgi:hypothetical protein
MSNRPAASAALSGVSRPSRRVRRGRSRPRAALTAVAGAGALAGALGGALAGAPRRAAAQGSGVYGQGIRVNLDTAGRKYVRFIVWNQVWARAQQLNPGSRVQGEEAATNTDVGIRRSRFLMYGQLTPSNLIMFHVGINNQTFNAGGAPGEPTGSGKKPQLFIHDLWNEQRVVRDKLYLGFGLSYWNGISRSSSASTLNFLGIDAPIYNWPNVDASDQFVRMPSIYAKGKLGRLDYRVALSQPFVPGAGLTTLPRTAAGPVANQAVYSNVMRTKATQGYLMWQALQTESNVLPFTVGSYLGTRRVFNVGAGWYNQPHAMRSYTGRTGADSVRTHTQRLLAADLFADLPFGPAGDRQAVTVYGVVYDYDYGPNFVRNIGIMNIGTQGPQPAVGAAGSLGPVFNGGGNAFPVTGTGRIAHTEAGYLLPRAASRNVGRLQPYTMLTLAAFDRLADPAPTLEGGVNWHLEGQHSKFTLHYRNRPIFRTVAAAGGPAGLSRVERDGSRGEVVLQSMIYF